MTHISIVSRIRDSIEQFLTALFDIREGEYQRVFLVQANVFLVILAHQIVKPVATAQFLSQAGITKLPFAFVLVAACAMLVSTLYAWQLRRVPLLTIIQGTTGMAAILLVLLGLALSFSLAGVWVLYALYVLVAVFGVVATSQIWILAGLVFTAREAARLFGLIGAGAIAGGITGGYVTSVLASAISSEYLLFLGAALFLCGLPISAKVWKQSVTGLTPLQRKNRSSDFGDHPIKLIRNSRHLLFLASIVGTGVVVAKLVDYQFNALAAARFDSGDDLAAFLGFWFSSFNVVSLLIQLFLTRRIVGMYGVGTSLFVLPSTLLLAAATFVFFPILSLAIFIKAADITLKQSVNKSATELLVLPLPIRVKNETKSFIDIFVDSAATGVSGLILIFMVVGLDLPVRFVSIMVVALAGCWLFFAYQVRIEYLNTFRERVGGKNRKIPVQSAESEGRSILDAYERLLRTGTDQQRLFVLEQDVQRPDSHLFDSIKGLLTSESPAIRKAALDALYFHVAPDISGEVEQLIGDGDTGVRRSAIMYMMARAGRDRLPVMDTYLKHADPAISCAALEAVAQECRNNPELQRHFKLVQRLEDKLAMLRVIEDPSERDLFQTAIIRSIGRANLAPFYSYLDDMLDPATRPDMRREAIIAAGNTLNSRFIPAICSGLVQKESRSAAVEALGVSGEGLFTFLLQALKEDSIDVSAVRHLPSVCSRIPTQSSVDFLIHLVEHEDVTVQNESLRSLNELKKQHKHLTVDRKKVITLVFEECSAYLQTTAILIAESKRINTEETPVDAARRGLVNLLERRLDAVLERIFRLLGLQYPPDDVLTILDSLKSDAPDHRANAVGYLDSLLDRKLRKVLLPIAETALLDTLSEVNIATLKIDVPDERSCLIQLLQSRDRKIKISVLHLVAEMRDASFRPHVEPFLNSRHPQLKAYAEKAIAAMN